MSKKTILVLSLLFVATVAVVLNQVLSSSYYTAKGLVVAIGAVVVVAILILLLAIGIKRTLNENISES